MSVMDGDLSQVTGSLEPQLVVAPLVSLLGGSSRTGWSPGVLGDSVKARYMKMEECIKV